MFKNDNIRKTKTQIKQYKIKTLSLLKKKHFPKVEWKIYGLTFTFM